jgi:putative ABC transport system substrate-binding protein
LPRVSGLVVQGSLPAKRIVGLAFKHHLPTASVSRSFSMVGGLLSYGADGPLSFRQSTGIVHKILQGANPADLPVEQPTKFELVINLKTAKALGLSVPQKIIDRADEVIE